jgi:hypothetical protein
MANTGVSRSGAESTGLSPKYLALGVQELEASGAILFSRSSVR